MHTQHQEAARICWDCRHICQTTLFTHCLAEGGKHTAEEHVKLMIDCMEICQTAADFMTRGSSLHAEICMACAKVCLACAESCELIGDDTMLECAKKCRECAASCEAMGKHEEAAKFVTA